MLKKTILANSILGITVIGLVTLIIMSDIGAKEILNDPNGSLKGKPLGTQMCEPSEVSLDFMDSQKQVSKKLCMTSEQYNQVKAGLKADMLANKVKGYDFDINNRDILFAVFNKEIEDKGILIQGANKETIRQELLNLLSN